MKGNEKSILLGMVVVAILIIGVAFKFFYLEDVEKAEQVENETKTLRVRLDELNSKIANKPIYDSGIDTSKDIINTVLSLYGPGTTTEKIIMLVVDMCQKTGCSVTDISFKDPTLIYASEVKEEGDKPEIQIYRSGMTANITCGYTQFKKITDFINSYSERMNAESFQASFDAREGALNVLMDVNMYGVTDENHTYVAPVIEDIPLGNTNIFKTIETAVEDEENAEENADDGFVVSGNNSEPVDNGSEPDEEE